MQAVNSSANTGKTIFLKCECLCCLSVIEHTYPRDTVEYPFEINIITIKKFKIMQV